MAAKTDILLLYAYSKSTWVPGHLGEWILYSGTTYKHHMF
jgi:hypothetical protein